MRVAAGQNSQNLTPASALQQMGSGNQAISWVSRAAEASPPKNRNVGSMAGQTDG